MAIKNILIAGASGNLGVNVLQKFAQNTPYSIRVLKRAGSSSTFPEGTEVIEADYSSLESLTTALQGQDVVISILGSHAIDAQLLLIDAAAAAGVQRFIPSEFGSDLDHPEIRKSPVFAQKVKIQDYLFAKVKTTPLTYTIVYSSAFLDWGLANNFLLNTSESKPVIVGGGDQEFSATSLDTITDALVGIVTHLEETKNRSIYIQDLVTSQNKLLALAKQVAPNRPWAPVSLSFEEIDAKIAQSNERLAQGTFDPETFILYLYKVIFDPHNRSRFDKNDNELLGIKGKTEADIVKYLEPLLQ